MARLFASSTDKIQMGAVANSNQDNYTLFIRAKPLQAGSGMFMLTNGHGGSFGEGYTLGLTSALEAYVDIAYVAGYSSGLFAKLKRWNNIVYMRRSGVSYMFLNGKKATATISNAPFTPGGFYTIGGSVNESGVVGNNFKGHLEHPAAWSVALTDAQALALSRGKILPYQLPNGLNQYHPLYGNGSVEQPFRAGSTLTVTGTFNGERSRPLALARLFNSIAVAVLKTFISVSDFGFGTDTISEKTRFSISETGTGSDTVSEKTRTPISDTGTGSESLSEKTRTSISDTGTGMDTVSEKTRLSVSEAGTGTDSVSEKTRATVTDSGTGVDSLSAKVRVILTEVMTAIETFTVNTGKRFINKLFTKRDLYRPPTQ